jgi:hypothetical protein
VRHPADELAEGGQPLRLLHLFAVPKLLSLALHVRGHIGRDKQHLHHRIVQGHKLVVEPGSLAVQLERSPAA